MPAEAREFEPPRRIPVVVAGSTKWVSSSKNPPVGSGPEECCSSSYTVTRHRTPSGWPRLRGWGDDGQLARLVQR